MPAERRPSRTLRIPGAALSLGVLTALTLAGCAAAGRQDAITADRLLAHFEAVAFSDQYDASRQIGRARKWAEPIRIAMHGDEALRFRPIVARHADELSRLTRLSISLLDAPGPEGNFEIRFVDWDDMEKEAQAFAPQPDWLDVIVEGAACLFIYRRNDRFEIRRALVLVSTRETPEHKERCLIEEMTQALGLPNDSDRLAPSIFNSFDRLSALSAADRLMLRMLYDDRIRPGQPRNEAMVAARAIAAELLASRR